LTAPARRYAAAPAADFQSTRARGLWQEAIKIRQEWLDHGLATQPADRRTAEHSLTMIYARISRPRPRFEWVGSPPQALPLVAGWPALGRLFAWIRDPHPRGKPPLASDLAMSVSRLRGALGASVLHPDPELSPIRKGRRKEPWPELPPLKAFEAGAPLGVVLHQGIRTALHRAPVRAALAGNPADLPVCWYGQGSRTRRGSPTTTPCTGLDWPATGRTTSTSSAAGPRWRGPADGGGPARTCASWPTAPNSLAPSRFPERGTMRSGSGPTASATATAGSRG
jgi:hypothetical protein